MFGGTDTRIYRFFTEEHFFKQASVNSRYKLSTKPVGWYA